MVLRILKLGENIVNIPQEVLKIGIFPPIYLKRHADERSIKWFCLSMNMTNFHNLFTDLHNNSDELLDQRTFTCILYLKKVFFLVQMKSLLIIVLDLSNRWPVLEVKHDCSNKSACACAVKTFKVESLYSLRLFRLVVHYIRRLFLELVIVNSGLDNKILEIRKLYIENPLQVQLDLKNILKYLFVQTLLL